MTLVICRELYGQAGFVNFLSFYDFHSGQAKQGGSRVGASELKMEEALLDECALMACKGGGWSKTGSTRRKRVKRRR